MLVSTKRMAVMGFIARETFSGGETAVSFPQPRDDLILLPLHACGFRLLGRELVRIRPMIAESEVLRSAARTLALW